MKTLTLYNAGKALACAVALTVFSPVQAAIFLGVVGFTETFDTQPNPTEWATNSAGSGAATIFDATSMDATVQPLGAADIAFQTADNPGAPGTNAMFRWNSINLNLESAPTGVAAALLMATIQNEEAVAVSEVNLDYDLSVANDPAAEGPIPGHRLYYSLTGLPNEWIPVDNFGTIGPISVTLPVGNLPSGELMYVLWADDNSLANPDGQYQIDNVLFSAVLIPEPSLGILSVFGSVVLGFRRRRR
ncbi:MAG: hypothetical protein ACR2OZ_19600 [Verrucomicrobiales bacterium]